MQEYKVNEFLTLKLENGKTIIYIAGKRFRQCKKLLLEIPVDSVEDSNEIQSIDEIFGEQIYNNNLKIIPPETEFWGHCSNIQVWTENHYDTRLIHSSLAFPLLIKLTIVGDLKAKKAIKKEIAKRFESGYLPVIFYLLVQEYPKYAFNEEELSYVLLSLNNDLKDRVINSLKKDIKTKEKESYALLILKVLITQYDDIEAKKILKNTILNILKLELKNEFNYLLEEEVFFHIFNEKDFQEFLSNSPSLVKILKNEKEIRDLYHSILQKLNSKKRVEFYEDLLVIGNYREDENKIKDIIYENLYYLISKLT